MKILIDMNLSPTWVAEFTDRDIKAVHWSTLGAVDATDETLLNWARENGYVVFTHDLDFSRLLALTHSGKPSVVQMRTQAVLPSDIAHLLIPVILRNADLLDSGALIVVDEARERVRILPLL